MKKLLLGVMAVAMTTLTIAQGLPVNEKTGLVTYMKVMETGNVKASEAKEVLTKWASRQVFSNVEDAQDKNFYKGKHKVSYPAARGGATVEGHVAFELQFFYKDGKFRYIMTKFVHTGRTGNGGKIENAQAECGEGKISGKAWNMIKEQTQKKSEEMIEEFTKALVEFQNDPARNDDW